MTTLFQITTQGTAHLYFTNRYELYAVDNQQAPDFRAPHINHQEHRRTSWESKLLQLTQTPSSLPRLTDIETNHDPQNKD